MRDFRTAAARSLAAALPLVVVLGLVLLPSPALAARSLLDAVPGNATAVLVIDSAPLLRATWASHPLQQAWTDPAMQRFLQPWLDAAAAKNWDEGLRQATGHSVSDILDLASGQVVLVIHDMSAVLADDTSMPDEPPFVIMADIAGHEEEVTALIAARPGASGEPVAEIEEAYRGLTLHLKAPATVDDDAGAGEGWTISSGVLVAAGSAQLLRQAARDLLDGATPAVTQRPGFQVASGRSPGADILFYADLETLWDLARQHLERSTDPTDSMMGVQPGAILDGLGVDAMEAVYASLHLAADSSRVDYGLVQHRPGGLLDLMALVPPAGDLPSFVPEDAVEASVINFDLQAMWTAALELTQRVHPLAHALLQGQVQQISASSGIDLEKDVLGSLGTRTTTMGFYPEDGPPAREPALQDLDRLYVVSLRQRAALEAAVNSLLALATAGVDPFTTSEEGGVTVHTMPSPDLGSGKTFSYAFTDEQLLIGMGSEAPIHRFLANLTNPRPSLWARADVRAALAALPAGASSVGFQDTASLLSGLLEQLLKIPFEAAGNLPVDPAARPDLQTLRRYLGATVAAVHRNGDGIFVTQRMHHP